MTPDSQDPRRLSWGSSLVLLATLGMLCLLGAWIAHRSGDLSYDDAVYLERGLHHAHQIANRPWWQLPARLTYSLGFERPKPPLFHGWAATTALALGADTPGRWIAMTALGPLALISLIVLWGGARHSFAAGGFALVALWAMPSLLELGTRVMVEVLLAAWVCLVAALIEGELECSSRARQLAIGVTFGLAALTKFTALMLLGPLLLWFAARIARASRPRAAAATLGRIALATLAVSGPWYALWGREALAFASESAGGEAWADQGSVWTRPLRLLAGGPGIGLTLGATALLLTVGARRRTQANPQGPGDWPWICALVAVPSGIVTCLPLQFEPRFWVPALGPVAIGIGRLAASAWSAARPIPRWLLGSASLALLLSGLATVLQRPPVSSPWALVPWLERLEVPADRPLRLCTLGSIETWNVFKVRLMNELAAATSTREISEIPAEPGASLPRDLGCDYVFVLDPDRVPPDRPHEWPNRELSQIREALRATPLVACQSCQEALGSAFTGQILAKPPAPAGD